MCEPIPFSEAISLSDASKRYLLLGNGFSAALYPDIFSYSSLLEESDFKDKTHLKDIFEKLGTTDFEHVIRALEASRSLLECYEVEGSLKESLENDAGFIKKILVETISNRHPSKVTELEQQAITSCNTFLANFNKIYSLNYDILLYWVLLSGREQRVDSIDDGFRLPDDDYGADYRVFDSPHSPTFFYLHGGLHLFDSGADIRKYVWCDTGKAIMEQVEEALQNNLYPLFVAEGESEKKMTKINHSAYLSKGYRSFEAICDIKNADLFVFGHSLDGNDDHFLNKIRSGKVKRLFISAYNHPEYGYDAEFIQKANSLGNVRGDRYPLEIVIFDAQSANVWESGNE